MTQQPTPTCGNLTPHPAHTVQPDADDPSEPMTCLGVWNLAAEPSGDPDPTWIALLDRARAGGEDAADAIIDAYSRGIRAGVAQAAIAAHPPFGLKDRIAVIDEIATYIRDGLPAQGDDLDAQAAVRAQDIGEERP
jgi:hypothetical protein